MVLTIEGPDLPQSVLLLIQRADINSPAVYTYVGGTEKQ
jgi:hypothetical protein